MDLRRAAFVEKRLTSFNPASGFNWGTTQKWSPQQVDYILRQALTGDPQWQYELFTLMQDRWPRLRKNLHELRSAVANTKFNVEPYSPGEGEPSASAQERADFVSQALEKDRKSVV